MCENYVNFEIIAKEDENVRLVGVIDINTVDDDEPDIVYYDAQGFETSIRTWLPLSDEFEALKNFVDGKVSENYTEILQHLWDFRDEMKTIEFEDYYLKINGGDEGVKIECEVDTTCIQNWGDFVVEIIPKINGEPIIGFAQDIDRFGIEFDPYLLQDDNIFSIDENGRMFFEISKSYFEDPENKDEDVEILIEEIRNIYREITNIKFHISSRFGDTLEQWIDSDSDDDFLYRINRCKYDEVEAFLKEEGLIDEVV